MICKILCLLFIIVFCVIGVINYENLENKQKKQNKQNIIIVAAGPPKKDRNRNLEIFNNKPLISNVIEQCNINNTSLYVVLNKLDNETHKYVKNNYPHVTILLPKDEKWISTVKAFINIEGDYTLVCGDIIDFKKSEVKKFLNLDKCIAVGKTNTPWGPINIYSPSKKFVRHGNICFDIKYINSKFKYLLLNPYIINKTYKMAEDWGVDDTRGLWADYQTEVLIEYLSKTLNIRYINREFIFEDND